MSQAEFQRRRKHLQGLMGPGAIAVVPAARLKFRSRDVPYPFRQDSDFWYLTGFHEPDAVALISTHKKHPALTLFCLPKDAERERLDGPRLGAKAAARQSWVGEAHSVDALDEKIPRLLSECDRVFYAMGAKPEFDQRVLDWLREARRQTQQPTLDQGVSRIDELVSLEHVLHDLRLFKSRNELARLRKAASVTVKAHQRAMRFVQPGQYEYQVQAELQHEFQRFGMTAAYSPIVAAGANACVLHYDQLGAVLEDNALLMIDAGCEFEHYATDVSRTFPINGRFSEAQKNLYQVVLDAQTAAINETLEGNSVRAPHEAAVKALTKGLLQLKLLDGTLARNINEGHYKRFYMHRTNHWLGLDVHDVGDVQVDGEWRVLEPGMVMTIEPGLYVPPGMKGVPKMYQGVGIRIEDDVLVTKNQPEVLTAGLVKDVADIEALMASA